MLLKADADGPAWTDAQIAEAFDSRTRTVEKLRERFVTEGFASTIHGKPRAQPATEKILDGQQEAQLIALRLGPPPRGYANWTLRLLARQLVELEIVAAISHETVRTTLKKRHDQPQDSILGDSARGRRGVRGWHGRSAGNLCTTVRFGVPGPLHG